MAQMRDMEISISKERAELARERGEVLRFLERDSESAHH
jgi:hypothetical protein